MLGMTTGGQTLFPRKKMKGWRLFLEKKMTGPTLFLTKKMTGQRLFFDRNHFLSFFVIDAFLSNAQCRICQMLRYCPVYYCSSLHIVIIPFLYDLKGALDSIQMKGQRRFWPEKWQERHFFWRKKWRGKDFFLVKKWRGKDFFRGPAHVPIILASSLIFYWFFEFISTFR